MRERRWTAKACLDTNDGVKSVASGLIMYGRYEGLLGWRLTKIVCLGTKQMVGELVASGLIMHGRDGGGGWYIGVVW